MAVPYRTEATAARRAAVKEISRGWAGSPARRPLPAGAAAAAAARAIARVSSAAVTHAACSWRIRSGELGAEHRPGGGPGAADRGLGFPQRGLRPVPPPLVRAGEHRRGVGAPVFQVGDQAEHLRHVLALHGNVVLDHPHPHGLAAAADISQIGPAGQERPDPADRDITLEADQHVGDFDEPADPGHAGEVAIKHPQPALGEHPRVLSQRAVQEFLLGFGLVPAGRAGQHGQAGAGGGVADQQIPQLRVGRGSHPRSRPTRTRPGSPSCPASGSASRPPRPRPGPQTRHGPVVVRASCPAAAAARVISCSRKTGAGPAASRQVDSTVAVGTANGICQGTPARSPEQRRQSAPCNPPPA